MPNKRVAIGKRSLAGTTHIIHHNGNRLEERPRIKVALTRGDRIFELVGGLALLAIWGLAIGNYPNLPDVIPIHYNRAGRADGFGGKGHILILPFMATALFTALTVLNKFPFIFNYPGHISQDNALKKYTTAARMIRYLKLIIVVIFGLLTFKTIQGANGRPAELGSWFLPLTMALVLIPMLYFVFASFKAKQ